MILRNRNRFSAGSAFRRGNGCRQAKNPMRSLNCLDASVAISSRHLHVIVFLRRSLNGGVLGWRGCYILTLAYYWLKCLASKFQDLAGLGIAASPASLSEPLPVGVECSMALMPANDALLSKLFPPPASTSSILFLAAKAGVCIF